jgi:hypothetical protein
MKSFKSVGRFLSVGLSNYFRVKSATFLLRGCEKMLFYRYRTWRRMRMNTMSIQKLYQQYIKPLNPAERLSLTAMIVQDLAATMPKEAEAPRQRSLLELEGLGAEIREGVDAQEYVNELRKEWDHRP